MFFADRRSITISIINHSYEWEQRFCVLEARKVHSSDGDNHMRRIQYKHVYAVIRMLFAGRKQALKEKPCVVLLSLNRFAQPWRQWKVREDIQKELGVK